VCNFNAQNNADGILDRFQLMRQSQNIKRNYDMLVYNHFEQNLGRCSSIQPNQVLLRIGFIFHVIIFEIVTIEFQ